MAESFLQADTYEHGDGWSLTRTTEKCLQVIGAATPILVDVAVRYDMDVVGDYETMERICGLRSVSVAELTSGILVSQSDALVLSRPERIGQFAAVERERWHCRLALRGEPTRTGHVGPSWLSRTPA